MAGIASRVSYAHVEQQTDQTRLSFHYRQSNIVITFNPYLTVFEISS